MQAAGGLQSARPKQVLLALQPQFPELGLRVDQIKWWVWRTRVQRSEQGLRAFQVLPAVQKSKTTSAAAATPPLPPLCRHLQASRRRQGREAEWLGNPEGPVRWTGQ